MIKKLSLWFISLFMILSILTNPVQEAVKVLNTTLPVATNYTSSSSNKKSNTIPFTITALKDGTGVNVYVGKNYANDSDTVNVTVNATGYSTPQTKSEYVPASIGKNFHFDFPFIKCNTTYKVSIKVADNGKTQNLYGQATLTYSEAALHNLCWNKGTFDKIAYSLEYHLNKHGAEIGATNLVEYIHYSDIYRTEILNDIQNGLTSKYKISNSTGPIPAQKYKNKTDARFAILSNSGSEILSFGK